PVVGPATANAPVTRPVPLVPPAPQLANAPGGVDTTVHALMCRGMESSRSMTVEAGPGLVTWIGNSTTSPGWSPPPFQSTAFFVEPTSDTPEATVTVVGSCGAAVDGSSVGSGAANDGCDTLP